MAETGFQTRRPLTCANNLDDKLERGWFGQHVIAGGLGQVHQQKMLLTLDRGGGRCPVPIKRLDEDLFCLNESNINGILSPLMLQ